MNIEKYKFQIFSKSAFIGFHLLLIFLFAVPIFAQNITGIVTDANNAAIQNATVSLSDRNKTTTDADGKFLLNANGETNLILKVEARNFAVFEKRLSENDLQNELKIVLSPVDLREDVTVSITNTETRLSETPASVVVLSRESLETSAAQTIDDNLRQIAGFNLFRRSSSKTTNPTAQGANFRGLAGSGASRSSVLLDGVSVNDAFGGWTYWTRIPRSSLAQIEVLRGGASSLYGDSALSGAVNLQTEISREKPIFRLETSAGTQKTFDLSTFGAFGRKGWNVSASFDAFRTRGYIPIAENERGAADSNANSRYENGFLTIEKRFSTRKVEDVRIFLRGNYFTERRDNGTRLTNNQTRFRQIVAGADFSVQNVGTFQIRAFLENQTYDQTFSAISNNRNTETLSRIQRVPSENFGANLNWRRAFGNHFVSASAEFRQVRGASDEIGFQNNRASLLTSAGGKEKTFSFAAQDFWRVSERLNLSFGARFDTWENADAISATRTLATNELVIVNFADRNETAFSPRIAAIFRLNSNFSLYGSFARSFRAPTLNELYRAFRVGNVLTQANENLKSERADTFETGLNFTGFARKLNLRGNFFVTKVSRPVVSITLTTTPNLITRQRQNVGETEAKGFEFDGEFAVRRNLRVFVSYLFTDSRFSQAETRPQGSVLNNELIGNFLPQVARNQLTFQTVYRPLDKLTISFQGKLSDAQFEDDLNTLRLNRYAQFDAFVSYKFRKIEIFSAIENIFDSRYDIGLTPNRTIAAPRFVRVGLRFDLGNK